MEKIIIKKKIDNKRKEVLNTIAKKEVNKDYDDKESEVNEEETKNNSSKEKVANVLKKDDKPKCMARIANGNQCRRSKNPNSESDYCTCHEKHCPYGRIDGPFEGKFLSVPKKRGPKFKHAKEYKLEELDEHMYIATQLLKIDGKCYLMDNNGILYTNDNNCDIIGRRVNNEIHWYI